jgi:hypothetical protein
VSPGSGWRETNPIILWLIQPGSKHWEYKDAARRGVHLYFVGCFAALAGGVLLLSLLPAPAFLFTSGFLVGWCTLAQWYFVRHNFREGVPLFL